MTGIKDLSSLEQGTHYQTFYDIFHQGKKTSNTAWSGVYSAKNDREARRLGKGRYLDETTKKVRDATKLPLVLKVREKEGLVKVVVKKLSC